MNLKYIGNCSDRAIAKIAEKKGRKASYKKDCREIKAQYPEMYHALALNYYNPWEDNTQYIMHNGEKYLCFVHSMTDYVFKIN